MNKKIFKILALTVMAVLCMSMLGCSRQNREAEGVAVDDSILQIDPESGRQSETVTLYFKHAYSNYLVPQSREVEKASQSIEALVVEELLKGPQGDEALEKTSVMPSGVKLIDINTNNDTVFVNLSSEFLNDIVLKNETFSDDVTAFETRQQQLKGLAIYSIVNSLTEIPGISQVKILVNNKAVNYQELRAEALLTDYTTVDATTSMLSISRNQKYILSPAKSVKILFESLSNGPTWASAYPMLYMETEMGSTLPQQDELEKTWSAMIRALTIDGNAVVEEEIKGDGTAFVTINYSITYVSGVVTQVDDAKIAVINSGGVWKVKLPDKLLRNSIS